MILGIILPLTTQVLYTMKHYSFTRFRYREDEMMRVFGICFGLILLFAGCAETPLSIKGSDFSRSTDPIVRLSPPPGRRSTPHGVYCTGRPFRELMENPAGWDMTRTCIDYLEYPCWILHQRFTDQELASYFSQINSWGQFELCLGVIAVKNLSGCHTGEECFVIESARWDRFESLGANIGEFVIDEPLTAVLCGGLGDRNYAVIETADWIELVRARYGTSVSISLAESYPYWNTEDDLEAFITDLQQECTERGFAGIDSFSLDFNWGYYGSAEYWIGAVELQQFCNDISLPFCMIYWPSRHQEEGDPDFGFYADILYSGSVYESYGGSPDIFAIQSWDYLPRDIVPEETSYSFTFAFLEFCSRYL